MPIATITIVTPLEKREPELENSLITHFTEMVRQYNVRSCDLDLLARVIAQMEKITYIDEGEQIEEVNLEDNG
jgi:hypothetical protein